MLQVLLFLNILLYSYVQSFTLIQNSNEFQSKILDNSNIHLIFFMSQAPPTKEEDTVIYTITEKMNKYDINTYFIDCSLSANKKACLGIQTPSIQLYTDKPTLNPYTKHNYRTHIPLISNVDGNPISLIERFVNKNYPFKATKLTTLLDLKTAITTNNNHTTPIGLLFTDKDTITLSFKSIIYHYNNQINFYYINTKSGSEILSYYGIPSSKPSLGLILPMNTTTTSTTNTANTDASSLQLYTGNLNNRTEVILWLDTLIPPVTEKGQNSDPSSVREDSSMSDDTDDLSFSTYTEETLLLEDLSLSKAYIIGVVNTNTSSMSTSSDTSTSAISDGDGSSNTIVYKDAVKRWREQIVLSCEGNVIPILLKCTHTTPTPTTLSTVGHSLCNPTFTTPTDNDTDTPIVFPYLYIIPYMPTTKHLKVRSLSSTIQQKYIYSYTDDATARKFVHVYILVHF